MLAGADEGFSEGGGPIIVSTQKGGGGPALVLMLKGLYIAGHTGVGVQTPWIGYWIVYVPMYVLVCVNYVTVNKT